MKYLIITLLFFIASMLPVNALTQAEIDRYIWQKQVVKNISSSADPLRQRLSFEIKKAISAGHLAPYRITPTEIHSGGGFYLWYHAGEPIHTFSEALKYLPDSDTQTRNDLKTYLKSEITQYSPYIPTSVYDRAPWLPLDKGTRREWYRLPETPINSPYLNQNAPVIQTFYHTWNYVDATGDTAIITNDWAKIKSLWDKLKDRSDVTWMDRGGCIAKYGDIGGCIGVARLAYLKNDSIVLNEALTRTSTGLTNGLNFAAFEETAAIENRYFSETHARTIRNYVYLNLFPETAKFIRDKNSAAATAHINKLVFDAPTWYATYSIGYRGGEISTNLPFMQSTLFEAHAQILKKDGLFLTRHLSTPITRVGDLYYIQKLISIIKSYGQTCWVDVRNNSETCE
jgi:hypothetical protein